MKWGRSSRRWASCRPARHRHPDWSHDTGNHHRRGARPPASRVLYPARRGILGDIRGAQLRPRLVGPERDRHHQPRPRGRGHAGRPGSPCHRPPGAFRRRGQRRRPARDAPARRCHRHRNPRPRPRGPDRRLPAGTLRRWRGGVIGVAHAGWRGARDGVLEATLGAMEALGAERGRTAAVIGPSISQGNYEVGPELLEDFMTDEPDSARFFASGEGDRYLFDLPGYGLWRLRRAGVAHAEWTRHCTYADPQRFYSYRRATHAGEADYGRLISAIRL